MARAAKVHALPFIFSGHIYSMPLLYFVAESYRTDGGRGKPVELLSLLFILSFSVVSGFNPNSGE